MDKPPRRYKRTSFWICLVLGLVFLMNGLSRLTSYNIYEQQGWPSFLGGAALFLLAAVYLFRRNRAADRACDAVELQRIEADRLLREKLQAEQAGREQRQAEWEATHGRIETKLAGVTFDNEDGRSRQQILKAAMAEDCSGVVTLENYEHKGAEAIRVEYEGECIGTIPRDRVAEILPVMKRISAGCLHVSRFVPEDEDAETSRAGGVIYRADLTLIYTKP